MSNDTNNNVLFSQYYAQWIDVYKKGAIREANYGKISDDTEVGGEAGA